MGQQLQQVSLSTGLILQTCSKTKQSDTQTMKTFWFPLLLYDKQFWFFVWSPLDVQSEIWKISFILLFTVSERIYGIFFAHKNLFLFLRAFLEFYNSIFLTTWKHCLSALCCLFILNASLESINVN